MTSFIFKRDCKVYLVSGSQRWQFEVYPDLTFSQTFSETAINVKTLHDQNALFEDAVITKANPANFSFTILLNNNINNLRQWFDSSRDLYIDIGTFKIKLETAIITRATLQISKNSILTVSIEGEAGKLTRFDGALPGTLVPTSTSASIARTIDVKLNTVSQGTLTNLTIELAQDVRWTGYDTLHASLSVTSAEDTQYPSAFVVSGRTMSGSMQKYLTDTDIVAWHRGSSLDIIVNSGLLEINMPSTIMTTRLESEEIFTRGYDFRSTYNPTTLENIIRSNT